MGGFCSEEQGRSQKSARGQLRFLPCPELPGLVPDKQTFVNSCPGFVLGEGGRKRLLAGHTGLWGGEDPPTKVPANVLI